jgi:uncharacterized membrane protein
MSWKVSPFLTELAPPGLSTVMTAGLSGYSPSLVGILPGTRRENCAMRRLHIHQPTWHHHPAVRSASELTRGERAADRLRSGMGSWGFVFGALVFLTGWMLGNRTVGFDKYPFILLNLILSCLAAMQGAILLIAAKREDQISSELAQHDYQTNLEADRIVKEIHALTTEIHAHTVRQLPPGLPERL